jgi:small nuclear ribonucleoprotein G
MAHISLAHPRFTTHTNDKSQQYLDKRLLIQLNGSRRVIGTLRGYDVFLNVVLDDALEEKANGEKVRMGMVVRV